jgi:hypothetical protein
VVFLFSEYKAKSMNPRIQQFQNSEVTLSQIGECGAKSGPNAQVSNFEIRWEEICRSLVILRVRCSALLYLLRVGDTYGY